MFRTGKAYDLIEAASIVVAAAAAATTKMQVMRCTSWGAIGPSREYQWDVQCTVSESGHPPYAKLLTTYFRTDESGSCLWFHKANVPPCPSLVETLEYKQTWANW